MRRDVAAALIALLLASAPALAEEDSAAEIERLLDFVAASGCDFERNGKRHSAADAADHLRLKYRRGRRYADTAEHFIDRLATASSWSGEPYRVYCDEAIEQTGAWLHRTLQAQRSEARTAAQR